MFFQGQTLYWTYLNNGWSDWPDPWPWPCCFKVKVWNSLIWGMGGWLTWNERDVSRSFMTMTVTYGKPWWGGWMYHIVTGVTSDVGVPSTYLVYWLWCDRSVAYMITSSNGNIFHVTGPLCGEFTGPGEFPAQRPMTRSFDVFFHLCLNKRFSKQPQGWWFETPPWSLWLQCNEKSSCDIIVIVNSALFCWLSDAYMAPGLCLNIKTIYTKYRIPILIKRLSWDHLIFIMGIL